MPSRYRENIHLYDWILNLFKDFLFFVEKKLMHADLSVVGGPFAETGHVQRPVCVLRESLRP